MAIIAISGKIGSGKDTVGHIIRGLTRNPSISVELILKLGQSTGYYPYEGYEDTWKVKKFADKLKNIVCLLINCTREQLEDADFKNKELGEEWWYFYTEVGGKKLYPYLEYKDKKEYTTFLTKLTPRLLLQLLGTDCGRNIIHPNIWVNSLFSEYQNNLQVVKTNAGENGFTKDDKHKWIITDLRFPNELKAVKDRNGITIRVNKDLKIGGSDYGYTYVSVNKAEKDNIIKPQHPSETALDNATFDYTIDNNGSIEELIDKVRKILVKESII